MKSLTFDLDGTLLDTLADIAEACNYMLKNYSLPVHPLNSYRKMVGNGFETLVKRAVPDSENWDEERLKSAVSMAREYYAQNLIVHTKPYPRIIAVLEQLAAKEIGLAVLSNKPDQLTAELINHFFKQIPFAVIQGAKQGIPLKPDPTALFEILQNNNWDQNQAGYVGDSDVDMTTARNAGVIPIGAEWGFRGSAELKSAGAAILVSKPVKLLDISF